MTGTTFFLHIKGNFFLTALHSFIEINSQTVVDIISFLRAVTTLSASASKKVKPTCSTTASKEASKDVTKVYISKVKTTCTTVSITECRMSELVVLSSLFIITKYCISLRSFLKFCFSFLITRISIRVILLSQYPISLFQIISRCILSYTKNLVIISFLICHI